MEGVWLGMDNITFVDLREKLNICDKGCPMRGRQMDTKFAPFEIFGSPEKVRVIFVGEAPGEQEAKYKRPFYPEAKSGSILRAAINELGLTDYAIANINCCWPVKADGRTRTPEEDECKFCKIHLQQFLNELNANTVILLGGTAAYSMLPDSYKKDYKITKLSHMSPYQIADVRYGAAFHPSYIARNGGLGSSMYRSWIIRIKQLIQRFDTSDTIINTPIIKDPDWFEIINIEELETALPEFEKYNDLGFDYEATDLEVWSPNNKILGFSLVGIEPLKAIYFYWPSEDYVLPKNLADILLNFFKRKQPWTYNCKYEMGLTWSKFGTRIDFNDSQVLCNIDCSPGKLKENARKYLDADFWEDFVAQVRDSFNSIFKLMPTLEEKYEGEYSLLVEDFNSFMEYLDEEAPRRRKNKETKKMEEIMEVRLLNAKKAVKDIYDILKKLKTMISDEEIKTGLTMKSGMAAVPLKKVAEYCCYDSYYTLLLRNKLWPMFGQYYPNYIAQARLAGVMESYGTNWNDEKAKELRTYYIDEACNCLYNLIQGLDLLDEEKMSAGTIIGLASMSPDERLEELKKIFNPLSNKYESQLPFWNIYRTDWTTALVTLYYFEKFLLSLPSTSSDDLATIINKNDVNETIENVMTYANMLLKDLSGDVKQKQKDAKEIIKAVQNLDKTWDLYFKRFAAEVLEFQYQAQIKYGGKYRYCCRECHKWVSDEKEERCPLCGKEISGGGLDIDNRDTWSDEFNILYYLKRFKKVIKSNSVYIEGKIGRINVNVCDYKDFTKPLMRHESYNTLPVDNKLREKERYIFTPSLFACTAATKRWQSGAHTVPPGSALNEMYVPRDINCCSLHYDYSQNEIRFMAALSGDENLLDAFRQGKDIHRYVASRIFKIPEEQISKKQRRFAKNASFAILYGKGIYEFGVDFCQGDIQQAREIYEGFFSGFPKVAEWIAERHKEAERGYVNTLFGDPLYLPLQMKKAEIKRRCQNWPIQSSASNVAGYGIWHLYEQCVNLNIKAVPVLFTHDSADFEIYIPHLFSFIPLMKYVAEDYLQKEFGVPVKIDWELGIHRNQMMKLEKENRVGNAIHYEFACNKNTFYNIVDRVSNFYHIDFNIAEEKTNYQSLEDLFLPKRAFSKYYGTEQTMLYGNITFNL